MAKYQIKPSGDLIHYSNLIDCESIYAINEFLIFYLFFLENKPCFIDAAKAIESKLPDEIVNDGSVMGIIGNTYLWIALGFAAFQLEAEQSH